MKRIANVDESFINLIERMRTSSETVLYLLKGAVNLGSQVQQRTEIIRDVVKGFANREKGINLENSLPNQQEIGTRPATDHFRS